MNGAEIRALREKIGLKRPELVERAGPPLTVAKLAGIETGRDPRYDELQAIQKAFAATDQGRRYLAGERPEPIESPKLKDTKEPSDPVRWTAENPTIDEKLKLLTSSLRGSRGGRKIVEIKRDPTFVKFESWAGFEKNDQVRIKAETFDVPGKENWLKGTYFFVQRVSNQRTGASWIDVIGGKDGQKGRPGQRHMRSFTEDRVVKMPKRVR